MQMSSQPYHTLLDRMECVAVVEMLCRSSKYMLLNYGMEGIKSNL